MSRSLIWFSILVWCAACWTPLAAQVDGDPAGIYRMLKRRGTDYVIAPRATLFARPDSTTPLVALDSLDPVHRLLQKGPWTRVRTRRGQVGYLRASALSDIWVFVSKSEHMVYVYRGLDRVDQMPADFGINIKGDKVRRGSYANPEDWRTPEGVFYVTRKNPASRFHKALVLNYPTPRHALRGLHNGIVSDYQYAEIIKSAMVFNNPPMNTPLGGWIEFHGSGIEGRANWTWGCIALENSLIDRLWTWVEAGTPVVVGAYAPWFVENSRKKAVPRLPYKVLGGDDILKLR